MAITVELKDTTLTAGTSPSAEYRYTIIATEGDEYDEQAITLALFTASPTTVDGVTVTLVRLNAGVEPQGGGIWSGTVRYGPSRAKAKEPPEPGVTTGYNFEITGEQTHVTQSLSTIGKYGLSGDTAPDFKGAIGVTHDSIEGVDIDASVYRFSETHYLLVSSLTNTYKGTLFGLRGKVNNATFRSFAAGECRFLGCRGSYKTGDEYAEMQFDFAAAPNKTNIDIGNGRITVASKKGWEYLWVFYREVKDDTLHMLVKRPYGAYVEQVYESGNFTGLGIGTT
jgi:hypothetical protein